jgi:DNA-binding transcriptional regulator YiaG
MAKREPKTMAEGLIQGLQEAVAHSRGELKLKTRSRELPKPAPKWSASQIRKLRKEVYQMSQPSFAILLNVTAATVRSWEQGQKSPSGAAARLLQILAGDRRSVEKLIAA